MNFATVSDLARNAMMVAMLVAAPMLIVALLVGLVVSILQTVTQIQEQTLSFVPKLIAAALVIAVSGAWMLEEAVTFGEQLMDRAPEMIDG